MNWIELEYVSVLGWGTLAERWKFYEEFPPESSIDIYRLFIDSRKTKLEKIYWSQRFKEIQKNMHIEWDVNWTLSLWKQNFKSLVTPINLVSYDGVDSVATHTTSQLKRFKNRIIDSIDLPLPPASTSYVSSTQSMANTRLMFSINSARYLEPFLRKLGFYSLMKKSLFWFDSYIRTDIFLKIINNWRLKIK